MTMLRPLAFVLALLGALAIAAPSAWAQSPKADPENTLLLDLPKGQVVIRLRPDLAPKHVERIKTLVRQGFYDGLTFHRVIADFMAQTGDPTGTGTGGSKLPDLPAEFSDTPFQRGALGAARTNDPNSANSQFFICFEAAPWLNGKYTMFGQVVQGMEHVDQLKKGAAGSGTVQNPDRIVRLRVAADAKSTSPAQQK
jgi:peptidylprolyl isomerase